MRPENRLFNFELSGTSLREVSVSLTQKQIDCFPTKTIKNHKFTQANKFQRVQKKEQLQ